MSDAHNVTKTHGNIYEQINYSAALLKLTEELNIKVQ